MTRSISFEINDRLEMGRYELHMSGSKVGFLSSGKMCARLRWDGKIPDCIERLHRRQMTGAIYVDRCFNSHVRIGSRGHDFEGVVSITQ